MAAKYDIPVSLKPSSSSKKKSKSKYEDYLENGSYWSRLSPKTRKLILYTFFLFVFACIFITALRNQKHAEKIDYELEINEGVGSVDDREKHMIGDSLRKEDDITDEIDILDSDEGEIQLEISQDDNTSKKNINKESKKKGSKVNPKKNQKKDKKSSKPVSTDDEEFAKELDDLVKDGNKKLNARKGGLKKVNNRNKNKNL